MKYSTICFDIDGTLYPPEIISRYMFGMGLKHPVACGLYTKMRREFRKQQSDFCNTDLEQEDFSTREAEMLLRICPKMKTREKARDFLDSRYYKPLSKSFKMIKHQEEVVRTFRFLKEKGIKIGVLSDWPICNKLSQIGVKVYIDFSADPSEIGYLKPDIHCFRYLLYNMKSEPSATLYVGDSYAKDIEGAAQAGLDAVLVNSGHKSGEKNNAADEIPGRPKALEIFENWKDFDGWLTGLIYSD